jgi:undecaprenyl-diphosphatase
MSRCYKRAAPAPAFHAIHRDSQALALLPLVILALVQGITEFLPVSSSGHLVIAWAGFDAVGWAEGLQDPRERLVLDIAVHVGTLLAVCLYFWRDLLEIAGGMLHLLRGRLTPGGRLGLLLCLATLPLVLVGLFFQDFISEGLHNTKVVAWATLGFGLVLWAADRFGRLDKKLTDWNLSGALLIGLAQVLAVIPGTSRSGITMTAARMLGYGRQESARIALLMAIPAIVGAGALGAKDLTQSGNPALGLDALFAAAVAFVFALLAIVLMLRWLGRAGFLPFVIYRILLGLVLLIWFV